METAKERVLKAINHQLPEIVPVNIGNIYCIQKWIDYLHVQESNEVFDILDLDVESFKPLYCKELPKDTGIFGTPIDNVFGSSGIGYGSSRGGYPLRNAKSFSDIDNYPWPKAEDFDFAIPPSKLKKSSLKALRVDTKYNIENHNETEKEKSISGAWIPLICTLFDLFGFEEALTNLYLEPSLMEASIKKIEEFLLEYTTLLCQAANGIAEILYFGDDFASQRGLLISPEHWRKFLLPTYRKIFDIGKSFDLKIWFHSCGTFRPIMSDLIDAGMDVWETVQVHLPGNDPEELKREYGKHICFFGAISTQTTLPHGTVEEVRSEVRSRINVLGENGGYICGSDHGIMPDVPIENVLAMIDEARR